MEGVDALLLPATPRVAPVVEESDSVRPLMTRLTRPFNVTGQPIVTLPAPAKGLPVGIQVVGHYGDDAKVAAIAAWLEDSWRTRAPKRRPLGPLWRPWKTARGAWSGRLSFGL